MCTFCLDSLTETLVKQCHTDNCNAILETFVTQFRHRLNIYHNKIIGEKHPNVQFQFPHRAMMTYLYCGSCASGDSRLTEILRTTKQLYVVILYVSIIVHEPDKIFITSLGTKPHHVFQQAYYPLITYLCDSNRDRVA